MNPKVHISSIISSIYFNKNRVKFNKEKLLDLISIFCFCYNFPMCLIQDNS